MVQTTGSTRVAKLMSWVRPLGAAGILLPCCLAIVFLALNVWRELAALERLSADNTQWALMQTEVETLRFQVAIEAAVAKGTTGDLADLRRWFNVIYSRVKMLPESRSYVDRLQLEDFGATVARMQAFLDRTVPLIDGPESELRAALPMLADMVPEIRQSARKLTLQARAQAAIASDARRAEVIWTLLALAGVTALLLLALSGLSLILLRLMRNSREQVRQNFLTSARLKTIFATSADAIIVTNRGGWIVDINPAAEAMFGHARPRALGIHALSLFLPPELATTQSKEIQTILDAAAARTKGQDHTPLRIELMGMRADGARIPVEMSLGAMEIATGGVIVALVRDISDRLMAQSALTGALEQAQASERAKADFIAVMSHEMRTPLNGLLGSLELLGATDLRSSQKDLINVMATSGQILLHHVNSVLDVSKAEADRPPDVHTDFDLDRLIDDCVANQAGLAATKGLKIAVAVPDAKMGWVSGDPTRLRQILLNLIGNAVKFTAQGHITVEAERAGLGQPVEIRVIDTGIGIPEADLDRVFDDFVTLNARYDRQAEGTGLGLGIARRVARAMGGEIGVESVLGDGSLFWLRLPLPQMDAAPLTPTAATAVVTATKPGIKVLIIEDNPVNRFVLRSLLEECGHSVVEADNGADGVAASKGETFDLIMTDISMPSMDGVEVARTIRQHEGPSQHARVVAVTAHALPADLARFQAAGIDDCMTKPITRVSLNAALNEPATLVNAAPDDLVLDYAQLADLTLRLGRPATAALIARVIAEGDAAEADDFWSAGPDGERRLHGLAGTAGTFGARQLQSGLAELLAARLSENAGDLARASTELSRLWHTTRTALHTEAGQLRAPYPIAAAGA